MLTVVSSYHLSFVRFFVVQAGESGEKNCFSHRNRSLGGFGGNGGDAVFFPKVDLVGFFYVGSLSLSSIFRWRDLLEIRHN